MYKAPLKKINASGKNNKKESIEDVELDQNYLHQNKPLVSIKA